MGLFDWLKPKPTCEDPVFGELEFDGKRLWTGHVVFPPAGETVAVTLVTEGMSGEEHRIGFRALCDRYPSLRPELGEALFSFWRPHLAKWRGDSAPVVTSADGMLAHTVVDWIEVESATRFRLGYGFTQDVGWDDKTFWVRITGWNVTPDLTGD